MKEANLVSFAVKLTEEGSFITKVAYLPVEDIQKCFKGDDAVIVKKIVTEMRTRFDALHYNLQSDIQASNSIL